MTTIVGVYGGDYWWFITLNSPVRLGVLNELMILFVVL